MVLMNLRSSSSSAGNLKVLQSSVTHMILLNSFACGASASKELQKFIPNFQRKIDEAELGDFTVVIRPTLHAM